jgi:hypothetical protein
MARRHIRHDIEAKGLDHTKSYSTTHKGEFIQNDVHVIDANVQVVAQAPKPEATPDIITSVKHTHVVVEQVVETGVVVSSVEQNDVKHEVEQPKHVATPADAKIEQEQSKVLGLSVDATESVDVQQPQEQKAEKKQSGKFQKKKQEPKTDVPQAGS